MKEKDKTTETEENKEKFHTKNSTFIEAWKNAVNGIIYATTTQGNIKKQLVIAVIVMLVSLLFNLNRAEFLCLMFTIILIIVAEMFNTAIETVVDLYTDLYHPKAKIAKDVGAGGVVAAGGVVVTAINALIVAYFLFFDKISDIGLNFISNIANSPVHLAFIGIFLTVILIVSFKAFGVSRKNKNLKDKSFMPSGISAIAFAATTLIWINSSNKVVLTLTIFMAIVLSLTRIEDKKRSSLEVFVGALTGIAVVTLIYGLRGLFLSNF